MNLINFFKDFYGFKFFKQYSPIWHGVRYKQATIRHNSAYIVNNPVDLAMAININGDKPVSHYITTNTHSKKINASNILYDKWFIDFDVSNPEATDFKNWLNYIRRFNYNDELLLQKGLVKQYQDLVVDEHIAEKSINEAKDFALRFEDEYGNQPALFFSGAKGCHAYCFFEPIKLQAPNRTFLKLKKIVESAGKYTTIDESVHKDVHSRKSRVPYTKHPHTGLTVVPFTVNDSYDDIMVKSKNPVIEPFNKLDYTTEFHHPILELDRLEMDNMLLEKEQRLKEQAELEAKRKRIQKLRLNLGVKSAGGYVKPDCRDLAQQILGSSSASYGSYEMYSCPFHDDNNPSMIVKSKYFSCLADTCGFYGNYLDFIMKFFNLSYDDAIQYLRNNYPDN